MPNTSDMNIVGSKEDDAMDSRNDKSSFKPFMSFEKNRDMSFEKKGKDGRYHEHASDDGDISSPNTKFAHIRNQSNSFVGLDVGQQGKL